MVLVNHVATDVLLCDASRASRTIARCHHGSQHCHNDQPHKYTSWQHKFPSFLLQDMLSWQPQCWCFGTMWYAHTSMSAPTQVDRYYIFLFCSPCGYHLHRSHDQCGPQKLFCVFTFGSKGDAVARLQHKEQHHGRKHNAMAQFIMPPWQKVKCCHQQCTMPPPIMWQHCSMMYNAMTQCLMLPPRMLNTTIITSTLT